MCGSRSLSHRPLRPYRSKANGDAAIRGLAPALKAMAAAYEPKGVEILLLNSSLKDRREAILAEAETSGHGLPVLIDANQLVGESLGVTRSAEAYVVNPKTWTPAYGHLIAMGVQVAVHRVHERPARHQQLGALVQQRRDQVRKPRLLRRLERRPAPDGAESRSDEKLLFLDPRSGAIVRRAQVRISSPDIGTKTAPEARERVEAHEVPVRELARDISIDPKATTQILKLVNSSSLGVAHRIVGTLDAINLLGVKRTIALVLSAVFLPIIIVEIQKWFVRRS